MTTEQAVSKVLAVIDTAKVREQIIEIIDRCIASNIIHHAREQY